MKTIFTLVVVVFVLTSSFFPLYSSAEGSKELMPDISGRAALCTVDGTFASFNSAGTPNSRLNIHITNPATEIVYLGFSLGYSTGVSDILGEGNGSAYYFRILDPNGVVVFGPQEINATNAIPADVAGYNQVKAGPVAIAGSAGYTGFVFNPSLIAGAIAGDYFIEFNRGTSASSSQCSFDYWDITVADNSGTTPIALPGRIWAKQWGFYSKDNNSGGYSGVFKGKLYSYTPDGFVNKVDFSNSDFRGGAFIIGMNSTGPGTSGNTIADRKSLYLQRIPAIGYKIFLNDPDHAVYPTGDETTPVLSMSNPRISCSPATVAINYNLSRAGNIEMFLDFNGNGIFDINTRDRVLTANGNAGENTIIWDKKDGLGNVVSDADLNLIDIKVKYETGVHHISLTDIEFLSNGFTVEAVRPILTPGFVSKFYWDDSNIAASPFGRTTPYATGTQPNVVELAGAPVRKWDNFTPTSAGNLTPGFGNSNSINTWWNSFVNNQTFKFSLQACSSLPVKISGFSATKKTENTVDINWQTSYEENVSFFAIEKSTDGINFSEITKTVAKGNSTQLINYSYTDILNNKSGFVFYRLRSVDTDGKSELSAVRKVDMSNPGSSSQQVTVYPNPASSHINIITPATWSGKKVKYEIVNVLGKSVMKSEYNAGGQSEIVNSSRLTTGLYILTVSCDGEKVTRKIIKN